MLMELAHDMPKLKSKYGVDFLLLDGEEFIFSEQDRFFLGSEYFAREYVKHKPAATVTVGACCWTWWATPICRLSRGAQQRVVARHPAAGRPRFGRRPPGWACASSWPSRSTRSNDDHVMLHDVGHIPCIDVIDFDYPPWHTQGDTPDKCSPLSLAKVGWVIAGMAENGEVGNPK